MRMTTHKEQTSPPLPPSPILMGEGRGEGSQPSSPSPSNSSPSSSLPASPGLHFGGPEEESRSDGGGSSPLRSSPVPTGEVSASSQTEGVFSSSSPNLTADLMDDLLDPASTPVQICKLHDLTLTQLESIITSPAFMRAAAQLKAITTARAAAIESNNHLQSQSLQRAIAHDAYLAATDLNQTRNPNQAATKARFLETARKANATLLPRPDGGLCAIRRMFGIDLTKNRVHTLSLLHGE